MKSTLHKLQEWYLAQCDGDWEHIFGLEIGNLDNPGWLVKIDLAETELEEKAFERVEMQASEHDWYFCWVKDKKFEIACGPLNLEQALEVFLEWAVA